MQIITTSTESINNIFFSKTIFIFFIVSVLLLLIPVYRVIYFDEFFRLLFVLAPITFYISYRFSLNAHSRFISLIIIVITLQLLIIRVLFLNGLFTSFSSMWCFVLPVVIFSLHRKLGLVMLIFNALFLFILYIFFRLGELSQFSVPVLTLTEETLHFIAMLFFLYYSLKHIRNITNASEIAQNRALAQKEKLVEQKNQFLSNISHELRTPLNGIHGVLELVKGKDERERVLLSHAKDASSSLNCIINDILKIQEVNEAQYLVKKDWHDIRSILTNIEDKFNTVIDHSTIRFNVSVNTNVPTKLYLDIEKVNEVLNQIISNAIKFTPQGKVHIHAGIKHNDLKITVTDNGIGMNEEILNHLFELFEQGDSSTTKNYQGMGLGMSIVQKIMKKLQGTIEVDSKPGKGSTFTLNIPVEM